MNRDMAPLRNDPLALMRIRRGLRLSQHEMGVLLGLDDYDMPPQEVVRQIEAGIIPISNTLSRLIASFEVALPGDALLLPKFIMGDCLEPDVMHLVHTRYPRFNARIVDVGTPDLDAYSFAINPFEKALIYCWYDDPSVLSVDRYAEVVSEARRFVVQMEGADEFDNVLNDD